MRVNVKTCALAALLLSLLFWSVAWADEADLVWSTFLGGSSPDQDLTLAVDNSGNAHISGYTQSADFPTTAGAIGHGHNGGGDVFVVKLYSEGSSLEYATFLGGAGDEKGRGIALDGTGYIYVVGFTTSPDFPTTVGAFDTTHNGGMPWGDTFVVKLDPVAGLLEYSTFVGGSAHEAGNSIAVDETGSAYISGFTASSDFPVTAGVYDGSYNGGSAWGDVFLAKLNPTGSVLDFATYLGGSADDEGNRIALESLGGVYITGKTFSGDFPTSASAFDVSHGGHLDAFVAKMNATGSALEYSTFLGGGGEDVGNGIALDDSGCAYVSGYTASGGTFPTTIGAYDRTFNGGYHDAFLCKLNPEGSNLVYSTFVGGGGSDDGYNIILDDSSNVYQIGWTTSGNFPTTPDAYDNTFAAGSDDVFVVKLNATLSALYYGTYLGGEERDGGYGIARDDSGYVYLAGPTKSPDFPTTVGAFQTVHGGFWDAWVAKLDMRGYSVPVVLIVSETDLPKSFMLHQNYPNPFNANTEIRYQIPEDCHVIMKIFNSFGQQVKSLLDADRHGGEYTAIWDGRDDGGQQVSSGLYFCRLEGGDFYKTVKMVLIK
jgi:hypothetical protein